MENTLILDEIFENRKKNLWYFFTTKEKKMDFEKHYKTFPNVEKLKKNISFKRNCCKEKLTAKQMKEDIAQMFFLLKNLYCGYYVQGDRNFANARKNLLQKVESKTLKSDEFFDLIFKEFSNFVIDKHFYLTNKNYISKCATKTNSTYFNIDYDIQNEGENFYICIDNKFQKIITIDKETNVEKFIKLYCDDLGKIKNCIVKTSTEDLCELEIQTERNNFKIALNKQERFREQAPLIDTELKNKNELHIINGNCKLTNDNLNFFKDQLEKINELSTKNKCLTLIDNRSNSGGNDGVIVGVLENLHSYNGEKMSYYDMISVFRRSHFKTFDEQTYIENIEINIAKAKSLNSFVIKCEKEFQNKKNELTNLPIIIFQGKGSASSGERYSTALFNNKNVLFMGDFTMGAQNYGNILPPIFLKNSGLGITFGTTYFMNNIANEPIENVGYEPDIFVFGNLEQQTQKMQKFIHNYKNNFINYKIENELTQ